jgi:hypothetical protein
VIRIVLGKALAELNTLIRLVFTLVLIELAQESAFFFHWGDREL